MSFCKQCQHFEYSDIFSALVISSSENVFFRIHRTSEAQSACNWYLMLEIQSCLGAQTLHLYYNDQPFNPGMIIAIVCAENYMEDINTIFADNKDYNVKKAMVWRVKCITMPFASRRYPKPKTCRLLCIKGILNNIYFFTVSFWW